MPPPGRNAPSLPKAPTGIAGLDAITGGGFPRGRPTLVAGGAGSGKSLLALHFLVHGARHGEPGVLFAFDETPEDIAANVRGLGFDIPALVRRRRVALDHVRIDRTELREVGAYTLDGLFARLGAAVDRVGARRVVIDSLETLFAHLDDTAALRAELRRLFAWLKERGLSAVVTAEAGVGALTRSGLEEYASDCVVFLDHRVDGEFATRRLRVVKYRGSSHVADEVGFIIAEHGISVLPLASIKLEHGASQARVSSGVEALDAMLGGEGYFRGSSVLVSGTPGTGKTSLAAHALLAACRRGERSLAFLFEESPNQFLRNMRSIGIDLAPHVRSGLLVARAARPTALGLESHLVEMRRAVEAHDPRLVVVDPVSNLASAGGLSRAAAVMTRLTDFLKSRGATAVYTSLASGGAEAETTSLEISSLMDTWLLVRDLENNGERNRVLFVLKSRGMAHSNQVREFRLTSRGIQLIEPYVGPAGVLTGTARLAQEARDRSEGLARTREFERRGVELRHRREALMSKIVALRDELELVEEERGQLQAVETSRRSVAEAERDAMVLARMGAGRAARGAAKPREGRGHGRA